MRHGRDTDLSLFVLTSFKNGPMEKYRSSMLEVSVTHQAPQWEWQVTFNGEMIANGFEEREQIAARFEGYNAMFLLFAAGWNP
jgi:hypothetical protein